ncbi:MAG: cupredoxin domain-containing protein [Thermomicrobiales bacterium]
MGLDDSTPERLLAVRRNRRRLLRLGLAAPALGPAAVALGHFELDQIAWAESGTPVATPTGTPVSCASPAAASPTATRSNASPTPAAMVRMTAKIRFEPAELTIRAGDTVTWLNDGTIPHTTTDDPAQNPVAASHPEYALLPPGAAPWSSGLLQPGQTFSHAFTVPGVYRYFCIPHVLSGMRGMIAVTC